MVDRAPSVVNVAEGKALVIGKVMVHTDQLLAPVGRQAGVGDVDRNIGPSGLATWVSSSDAVEIIGGGDKREERVCGGRKRRGQGVVSEGHPWLAGLVGASWEGVGNK